MFWAFVSYGLPERGCTGGKPYKAMQLVENIETDHVSPLVVVGHDDGLVWEFCGLGLREEAEEAH